MKTGNEFAYRQLILYGVLTELSLVLLQFVFMKIYGNLNPDENAGFTTDYMKQRGFYVFQVIGFFLYTSMVFFLRRRVQKVVLNKMFFFLISGAIVEFSFYMIIQSLYEGAFLFSILDKFIAGAFGLIIYYYTTPKAKAL